MKESIKNYLGLAGVGALVLLSIAGIVYAGAYAKSVGVGAFRSFSVSGEGRAVAIPDIARVTLTVLTEGGTGLAKLQEENTKKANSIVEFAKEEGVDKKDIKTAGYQITPRYEYFSCGGFNSQGGTSCPPPKIVGYSITQSIELKVRNFDSVGRILSVGVEKGANTVGGPFFTFDDPEKAKDDARKEAIAKAKEKARAMADAGGFRVGKLLSIDGDGGGISPMYDYGVGGERAFETKMAESPTIEPGSENVLVTVTLTYEIK